MRTRVVRDCYVPWQNKKKIEGKKERVNESDEWTAIGREECCLTRILSNYKFLFNRKDWYEALEYEKNDIKVVTEHIYTNHCEKKAWLSLNTF